MASSVWPFLARAAPKVVVRQGVTRVEADGLLVLADRLVGLAFLAVDGAEVVVGVGIIRFEADGFLVMTDSLIQLTFLAESVGEVVMGKVVVLGDFKRMPEQDFTVIPIASCCRVSTTSKGRLPRHLPLT